MVVVKRSGSGQTNSASSHQVSLFAFARSLLPVVLLLPGENRRRMVEDSSCAKPDPGAGVLKGEHRARGGGGDGGGRPQQGPGTPARFHRIGRGRAMLVVSSFAPGRSDMLCRFGTGNLAFVCARSTYEVLARCFFFLLSFFIFFCCAPADFRSRQQIPKRPIYLTGPPPLTAPAPPARASIPTQNETVQSDPAGVGESSDAHPGPPGHGQDEDGVQPHLGGGQAPEEQRGRATRREGENRDRDGGVGRRLTTSRARERKMR